MAYKTNTDTYTCDFCGHEMSWDGADDYGTMWGCEECEREFCTKCFVDRIGRKAFETMLRHSEKRYCPDCYQKIVIGNVTKGET